MANLSVTAEQLKEWLGPAVLIWWKSDGLDHEECIYVCDARSGLRRTRDGHDVRMGRAWEEYTRFELLVMPDVKTAAAEAIALINEHAPRLARLDIRLDSETNDRIKMKQDQHQRQIQEEKEKAKKLEQDF